MLTEFAEDLKDIVAAAAAPLFSDAAPMPPVEVEVPAVRANGDFACNLALKSARVLRSSPMEIAERLLPAIREATARRGAADRFQRIEAVPPGFINFHLAPPALHAFLEEILSRAETYGRSRTGEGRRVQIEFVSANPTGPLSVAHARQAAVGDALANILAWTGSDVVREYYVNDEGNQIDILGRSLRARALEAVGESEPFPEEGYRGEYIRSLGRGFLDERGLRDPDSIRAVPPAEWSRYGVARLLEEIRRDLEDFGVRFDVWTRQSLVATRERIEALLEDFRLRGRVFERDGALWFRSTEFGDDKDRVVRKRDGGYTYFTPDIVYHKDKFERGFTQVVDIWGPDHHGYIPRLKAAVQALGYGPERLAVLIVQLATIYRDGRPVSMSTRRGRYISLREVLDEVGRDAARFFFFMRRISAHLDFDLELAKKETPENPVYYIQYAHARIHSILRRAAEAGIGPRRTGLRELREEGDLELIRKAAAFPGILRLCAAEMDPFALANYLLETAIAFHRFYDGHRVVDPSRPDLSAERLALIDAVRLVLANGLGILGVSAPEKM